MTVVKEPISQTTKTRILGSLWPTNLKFISIIILLILSATLATAQSNKEEKEWGYDPFATSTNEAQGTDNFGEDLNWTENSPFSSGIISAPPPPPTPVPIDGGLGFLVLAGAGYGMRRLVKKKVK